MVCFCKDTMAELRLLLPSLNVPMPAFDASAGASASLGLGVSAGGSLGLLSPLQALADWLASVGLPAPPWQPDPAWLGVPLPRLTLDASAVATLQAFAQLQVLAQSLGIDLTVSAQATAFARLAATLHARLSVLLSAGGGAVDAGAWIQLSAALTASAQVTAALRLGLLPAPPPMGPPLSLWRAFLSELRALLPVIAIAGQLGFDLSVSLDVQLAAMLRLILRIPMPAMTATLSLMLSLTAALSAIAELRLQLGIDPLKLGLPAVRLMVAERLAVTASLVEQAVGASLPAFVLTLPRLDYCPTLMAPPAVVIAAMSLKLPPLAWKVPAMASLPVLSVGLPVASFCAQLNAAFGLQASLSPCMAGCDAQALLTALG